MIMSPKSGKKMAGKARRKCPLFILWASCLFLLSSYAWNQEGTEWKLRVSVENAVIRLQPDLKSPVIATLPQGTILNSYEAEGAWFRVVLPPGKEGIVVIGYIATNEVEILEEKIQRQPDFWEAEAEEYRGFGISVKLTVGWNFFSRGDIDKGARGLFDQTVDGLLSLGYTLEKRDPRPFRSGIEAGGDIIYHLNPRIGIGIGASYVRATGQSFLEFAESSVLFQEMWSVPAVDAYSFRLGISYAIPVNRWLTVCVHGGPALCFVKYNFSRSLSTTSFEENYYQKAKATSLGFRGGLGLEIYLNQRTAILIEAQGRYAKFTDLRGSEKYSLTKSTSFLIVREEEGSLYYLEEEYPRLAILPDGSSGDHNARKAVFNFTGVSLMGGLRVRF
jgi:hypothetical protein